MPLFIMYVWQKKQGQGRQWQKPQPLPSVTQLMTSVSASLAALLMAGHTLYRIQVRDTRDLDVGPATGLAAGSG